MTQSSEERVAEQSPLLHKARILPFERPQSAAQRAVQQRAQETIELEQTRRKVKITKFTALRWLLVIAIAAIPMALTLGAVDGILRAMGMVNAMIQKEDAERAQQAPPAAVEEESTSQPGVVMLKSFDDFPTQPQPAGGDTAPSKQP